MFFRPDFRGDSINNLRSVIPIGGINYRRSFAYERANEHQFKHMLDGQIQRFEVRAGDLGDFTNTISGNERSEVVPLNFDVPGHPGSMFALDEEGWLAYSFRVDTPVTADFAIVGQFHNSHGDPGEPGHSPPMSFVCYPSTTRNGVTTIPFALATLFDPNPISTIINPGYKTRWSGSLTMGVWKRIVLRFRSSIKGTGLLQMWHDGEKVLDLKDISFGFNDQSGFAYWQWGIYRHADANTMIAMYANMRFGRENLSHLIDRPRGLLLQS